MAAAGVLLVFAGLLAYVNSFRGAFVFDDKAAILTNSSIRDIGDLSEVLHPTAASVIPAMKSRPMLNLSVAVDYALWDRDVRGYHATNLAIHIAAGLLLFGVVRRTCLSATVPETVHRAAAPLAAAVSLIWLVHPLQTESVTYIIQRAESIVSLFCLLTLYCVLRGSSSARPTAWYVAAVVACLLGMGSKEIMITAPLVVLLYDRCLLAGSFRAALKARWRLYVGLGATWGPLAWLMTRGGEHAGTAGFGMELGPLAYAGSQFGVILHYLRLSFWPDPLVLHYGWPAATTAGEVILPAIPIVALLAVTVWALVRRPRWGFLGVWFFVLLAPTSSIIPIQDLAYEHRMYLPLAGVVATVVIGAYALLVRCVPRRSWGVSAALAVAVAAVAVALVCVTLVRNEDYATELTLWRDTVEKRPNNIFARGNLGAALISAGRYKDGIEECRLALRFDPDVYWCHFDIARALAHQGHREQAILECQEAVKKKPDYGPALCLMGLLQLELGRKDQAASSLDRAVKIDPSSPEIQHALALACAAQGKYVKTIKHHRLSLELKKDQPKVHTDLGQALLVTGNAAGAIEHFEQALELNPKSVAAMNNLAWILATRQPYASRHAARAVALAEQAAQLAVAADQVNVLDTMAAAYASAGRYNLAVERAKEAIVLATSDGQEWMAKDIQRRLASYQAGRPWREGPPANLPGP